ncbi:hypothetical protein BACCAC_00737 [Bacteroides caccae ATCC 43185]|nr:hypothetical protein BACCAC_00737 [Bacteroides caccae ATCC 43185]
MSGSIPDRVMIIFFSCRTCQCGQVRHRFSGLHFFQPFGRLLIPFLPYFQSRTSRKPAYHVIEGDIAVIKHDLHVPSDILCSKNSRHVIPLAQVTAYLFPCRQFRPVAVLRLALLNNLQCFGADYDIIVFGHKSCCPVHIRHRVINNAFRSKSCMRVPLRKYRFRINVPSRCLLMTSGRSLCMSTRCFLPLPSANSTAWRIAILTL